MRWLGETRSVVSPVTPWFPITFCGKLGVDRVRKWAHWDHFQPSAFGLSGAGQMPRTQPLPTKRVSLWSDAQRPTRKEYRSFEMAGSFLNFPAARIDVLLHLVT